MTKQEKARVRASKWQKDNPERRKEIRAKWIANNIEQMRAIRKAWKLANPEKVRLERSAWMRSHPETRAANEATRRARKMSLGGRYTAAEIRILYKNQKGLCVICENDMNGVFHRDHIMPLFLNGSNGIENIQLLCPSCNSKKGSKHPKEFSIAMDHT